MFIQHPQRLPMLAHHCGLWHIFAKAFNMQYTTNNPTVCCNTALSGTYDVYYIDFYFNFSYKIHATSTNVDVVQNLYLLLGNLIVFIFILTVSAGELAILIFTFTKAI